MFGLHQLLLEKSARVLRWFSKKTLAQVSLYAWPRAGQWRCLGEANRSVGERRRTHRDMTAVNPFKGFACLEAVRISSGARSWKDGAGDEVRERSRGRLVQRPVRHGTRLKM